MKNLVLFVLFIFCSLSIMAQDSLSVSTRYYTNWMGQKCLDFSTTHNPYQWRREFSGSGFPLSITGWIIYNNRRAFRAVPPNTESKVHTSFDNYSQYAPYPLMVALKLAGYHGRSSWDRFLVSTAMANGIMALAVNSIKYTRKVMRPDGSSRNSFPSGHTATAFVAATILHKEYGLTRSPLFSVGGYAVATGTAALRVLNNRHWASDVLSGAGIGIMSTEIGYLLSDLLFKDKGLMRLPLQDLGTTANPSFFNIQMGVGLHGTRLDLRTMPTDDYGSFNLPIKQGQSTMLGAEGAYFLTPHIGVGAQVRVYASSVKEPDFHSLYSSTDGVIPNIQQAWGKEGIHSLQAYDPYFTDISLDAGIYGNWPLTDRLAIGGKFLVGKRFNDGLTYRAIGGAAPKVGGQLPMLDAEELLTDQPDITTAPYDFLRVEGNASFNWIAGLSATYHYKDNLAWKIFADIDSSHGTYTGQLSLLSDEHVQQAKSVEQIQQANTLHAIPLQSTCRSLPICTIGASINITF